MKRIFFLLFSALVLFSCAPSVPVQTSVVISDSLVAVTFNDTTKLFFRITAVDEVELTWDATDGKKYNSSGRYQHKGLLVVPSQITINEKVYNVTSVAQYALFQQRSLIESLRELIVIAHKVGSFLPHRLHRDYRRSVIHIRAKRVRE